MRKRAEEKFHKDLISRVENERESLQIASEQKMQALVSDIIQVYKYNIQKIYFDRL